MVPQILYWKWQEADEKTIMSKAADIAGRCRFTHIYISTHNLPENDRVLTSKTFLNTLNKCVEYFKGYGIGVVFDVDFTRERMYVKDNGLHTSGHIKCFTGLLDSDGKAEIEASGAEKIINCFAVVPGESKNEFKTSADIRKYVQITDGKLIVCAGKEFAGCGVVSYLYKTRSNFPDLFLKEYIDGTRKIFETVKNVPLAGAATDELGLGLCTEIEYRKDKQQVESIDFLDINKVNFFAEWLPYSDGMRKRYYESYNGNLDMDLLYFWHKEKNNCGKSIKVVNQYFENIRTRMAEIEETIYNFTKEYIGDDAFVGTHTTWWGDELDNNFDKYHNGLDWWVTKRDYAQTDELVIIPLRLGLARKCKYNLWYNMWYSMRTMDIKTYYKETYYNTIYGGRTHQLGYECNEPGVVLELKQPGYLEKVFETECKIKKLNELQRSRPDSRVLVVFGYEAVTNHCISDPEAMRVDRRGAIMHNMLKTTKEIFMDNYLCELIPSTELETDNFHVENSKAVYCNHEYDAVIFLYPEGITQKVYNVLRKMSNEVKNLIVAGGISILHDGTKTENIFKNSEFYHDEVSPELLLKDLKKMNITKNHGDNWCMFEDGSITVSNINADLSVGNGVEYNGKKYDADILCITADGICHEI